MKTLQGMSGFDRGDFFVISFVISFDSLF